MFEEKRFGKAPYVSQLTCDTAKMAACAMHMPACAGSGCLVNGTGLQMPRCCILTNNHVCTSWTDALGAKVVFNKVASGSWIEVSLDPSYGFHSWKAGPMDFCIVAVHPDDVGKLPCDPVPLMVELIPAETRPITIWQHPGGGLKCMSQWTVEKVVPETGEIRYINDTEQGSSGSPIFDNMMRLVGIHSHGGISNGGCLLYNIINQIMQLLQSPMAPRWAFPCVPISPPSVEVAMLDDTAWPMDYCITMDITFPSVRKNNRWGYQGGIAMLGGEKTGGNLWLGLTHTVKLLARPGSDTNCETRFGFMAIIQCHGHGPYYVTAGVGEPGTRHTATFCYKGSTNQPSWIIDGVLTGDYLTNRGERFPDIRTGKVTLLDSHGRERADEVLPGGQLHSLEIAEWKTQ